MRFVLFWCDEEACIQDRWVLPTANPAKGDVQTGEPPDGMKANAENASRSAKGACAFARSPAAPGAPRGWPRVYQEMPLESI